MMGISFSSKARNASSTSPPKGEGTSASRGSEAAEALACATGDAAAGDKGSGSCGLSCGRATLTRGTGLAWVAAAAGA